MPIDDRDYVRGSHPPYCTCKDCTAKRLRKLQSPARSGAKSTRTPHGTLPGWVLTLTVVFIVLLLGFVVWSVLGIQITVFFYNLLTSSPPVVTEELPHEQPSEAPRSTQVQAPVYQHEELVAYSLELINQDRENNGLAPVTLGSNTAAQKHAEERLANGYCSHWGMDGLKPYMRYTLAGGVNYDAENGFITETYWIGGRDPSYRRDPKEMLKEAEETLMVSPDHRKTILGKWHKKVNIGIAYTNEELHLVQQFEGDYIEFSTVPQLSGDILSMKGRVGLGTFYNITLQYDPPPQPLTPEQLSAPPYDYAYSLGENIGVIIPPAPPGSFYTDLPSESVVATRWNTEVDGSFSIEANISPLLENGQGVYTVVVWVETDGEFVAISNYSIFIK